MTTDRGSATFGRMNTWRELIAAWGKSSYDPDWNLTRSKEAWARSLGVKFKTAEKQYQRNSVPVDYWPLIVARAPQAGVSGVTLELLVSLKSGVAKKDSPNFRASDARASNQVVA